MHPREQASRGSWGMGGAFEWDIYLSGMKDFVAGRPHKIHG